MKFAATMRLTTLLISLGHSEVLVDPHDLVVQATARGVLKMPGSRSIATLRTPCCDSTIDRISPTGPQPMIATSYS